MRSTLNVKGIRIKLFFAPRIWKSFNLFRQHAAEHLSSYVSTAEGNFLAKTSSFENVLRAVGERFTAEGDFWLFTNHETTVAVVERAKESTDKRIYWIV